jgi:hypothetical protein
MTTYALTSQTSARQQLRVSLANRAVCQSDVLALLASLIDNDSSVPGVTVRDALNNLLTAIPLATPWDHVVRSLADLPAPVGGFINLTTGSWAFAADIDITPDVLRVEAGQTVLLKGFNKTISTGVAGTRVLEVNGVAVCETLHLVSANTDVVRMNVAGAKLELQNCSIENQDDGTSCVNLALGTSFRMYGGYLYNVAGTGAPGVVATGNFGDILLEGVTADGCDELILHGAGTQNACSVIGCRCESNCVYGIQWASASIPTQGLAVVGCRFNLAIANVFNGFTAASARVNAKANTYSGGLMHETAIVP